MAALTLLAARPWGALVLACCWLVAAIHGAARLVQAGEASVPPDASGTAVRALLYCEKPEPIVRRRLHLLATALGYAWRPADDQTVVLDRGPKRRGCLAAVHSALALAALLMLVWPRVSGVEAVALVQGDTAALSVAPGVVIASRAEGDGRQALAVLTAAGDVAVSRLTAGVWLAPGLGIVLHAREPALLVRPGASPLSSLADAADTASIGFSAADRSRLVTVPEIDRSIRVSLVEGGGGTAFDVQLVGTDGAPVGDAYRLDRPAVLTLLGVALAFRPTFSEALTVWRAPLAAPVAMALLLAGLAALLAWAHRGQPALLAIRASGALVGVEFVAPSGPTRAIWLPLLRLILR